jgi:hypothetical protein
VYVDAALRHLNAWFDGEQEASDSGVHHLGHARACMAILLDAEATGNLIDDRPAEGRGAFCSTLEQLNAKIKARAEQARRGAVGAQDGARQRMEQRIGRRAAGATRPRSARTSRSKNRVLPGGFLPRVEW